VNQGFAEFSSLTEAPEDLDVMQDVFVTIGAARRSLPSRAPGSAWKGRVLLLPRNLPSTANWQDQC
jgi:hypothetical protein